MDEVFADAFYWIALANPADQWHAAAKEFDEANPATSLVTTEEVLSEFLNYYAEAGRHRRRIVGAMCEQVLLYPNLTVVAQSHESFSQGVALYRQREDRRVQLDRLYFDGCLSGTRHSASLNEGSSFRAGGVYGSVLKITPCRTSVVRERR